MDAYSYLERGNVFANAQTGNLLLFGVNLAEGNYFAMLSYLLPVLAFTLGILLADTVRCLNIRLHWRQLSVLLEAVILICVAFFPHSLNPLANSLTSFCLRHSGRKLSQDPQQRSGYNYVYRKLKKRNRESAPLSANP